MPVDQRQRVSEKLRLVIRPYQSNTLMISHQNDRPAIQPNQGQRS